MKANYLARTAFIATVVAGCACRPDTASVATAAVSTAQAQVPSTWRQFAAPPALDSPEVSCSLHTGARWRVFFDGNTLGVASANNIREREPIPYEIDFSDVLSPASDEAWRLRYSREEAGRIVTKVSNGWLIGFYAGENGGSLWWYPAKPGRGKKLWDGNVLAIERGPDATNALVLSGLAHLSGNEGTALWVANKDTDDWQVVNRATLRGAPYAHAPHPGGMVIAHTNGVDLVSSTRAIQPLVSVSHWMSSPVSVAVGPQGEIAVGRALFVSLFRRDSKGYSEEIYLPAQCATFRDDGGVCSCDGH